MSDSITSGYNDHSTPGPTCGSLVRGVCAHDPESWRRLARLFGPVVYRWCRRVGLESDDAADVVQEVFWALADDLSRVALDGSMEGVRGRLWVICRDKVRDFCRRGRRRGTTAEGDDTARRLSQDAAAMPDDSESDQRFHTGHLLARGVLQLLQDEFDAKEWRAFWDTAIRRHGVDRVAAELAMSTGSVCRARGRVLRRVRQELGELLQLG